MIKKICFLGGFSAAFLLPFSCMGQTKPAVISFPKIHLGAGVALEYMNLEGRLCDNYEPFGANYRGDRAQIHKGVQAAPFIEGGLLFPRGYYLGVNLSWRYSDAKTKSRAHLKNMTYFFHTLHLKNYINVLVKAGYQVMPNLLVFGHAGPSVANWDHITDQLSNIRVNRNQFKTTKKTTGLAIGGGVEYHFKDRYALSLNYTHHYHRPITEKKVMSFSEYISGYGITRTGDITKKIRLSYSTVSIGIKTYFQF